MAIAIDTSVDGSTTSTTTLSWNHTIAAGAVIAVWVQQNGVSAAFTATVGGSAMSLATARINVSANVYQYLFYHLTPGSGSQSIVVTQPGTAQITGYSTSYKGVDTSGLDGTTSGSGTGTSVAATIVTTVNNDWMLSCTGFFATPTAGTNSFDRSAGIDNFVWDTNGPLAVGSNSMNWTLASAAWAYTALAFKPAGAATAAATVSTLPFLGAG